jgi:hypothetical protein
MGKDIIMKERLRLSKFILNLVQDLLTLSEDAETSSA